MHPARDEWMQGDRYGVVVGITLPRHLGDLIQREQGIFRSLRIKLDKSGRIVHAHPDEPTFLEG